MSTAVAGVGTELKRWNSVLDAWESISEVGGLSGPSINRRDINVTSLGDSGGYRQHTTGFRDGGTVEFLMYFTRSGYEVILADYESNLPVYYLIVTPDGSTLAFQGLVVGFPLEVNTEDAVKCVVGIKVTGVVVLDDETSAQDLLMEDGLGILTEDGQQVVTEGGDAVEAVEFVVGEDGGMILTEDDEPIKME